MEQLESYGLKRSYSFDPDAERATMHGEHIKAEIRAACNNEIYNFEISHITIDQAVQILKLLQGESSQ